MRTRASWFALLLPACAGTQASARDLEAQLRTLQAQVARQSELLERLQADVVVLKEQVTPRAKNAAAPEAQPDALLADALSTYQRGDAAVAQTLLARFVAQFDGHARLADALYWLGECHLEQEHFADASAAFDQVVRRFPKTDRAPEALLKLGLAYEGSSDQAQARTAFEQLIKAYPGTAAADVARLRLVAVRP